MPVVNEHDWSNLTATGVLPDETGMEKGATNGEWTGQG
jgi:hypothetical protein